MPLSTLVRFTCVSAFGCAGCRPEGQGAASRCWAGSRSWTDTSVGGIDPVAWLAEGSEPLVEFVAVEEQPPVLFVVRDRALGGELVQPLLGQIEVGGGGIDAHPWRRVAGRRLLCGLQLEQPLRDPL